MAVTLTFVHVPGVVAKAAVGRARHMIAMNDFIWLSLDLIDVVTSFRTRETLCWESRQLSRLPRPSGVRFSSRRAAWKLSACLLLVSRHSRTRSVFRNANDSCNAARRTTLNRSGTENEIILAEPQQIT